MPRQCWHRCWQLLAAVLVATGGLGCAGSLLQSPQVQPPLAELPFPRLASADSAEFLILQQGADFAADLPNNRFSIDGTLAQIAPAWPLGEAHALDSAAYALYRLKLDASAPATLTAVWEGVEPPVCWIGLAQWGQQIWQWQLLPAGGLLELADPAPFSTAEQHCVVALVVLGDNNRTLASLGFGEEPPPPTGDGYTLYSPWEDTHSYLIDMDGNVVHSWDSPSVTGMNVDLLPNGHLLRQRKLENGEFIHGGVGGRIEEYDWDGNLLWYHEISNDQQITHHDFEPLPNGNILLTVWNTVTKAELVELGRDPSTVGDEGMLIDTITEIEPLPVSGANVVWEWNVREHLIQDFDDTKAGYGDPALHPELVDMNSTVGLFNDWLHVNGVAYNAELDQVMISVSGFSEIWIVDHSTTAEEVKGHTGGSCGRGGDLLYRWGNPEAYRQGGDAERQLYGEHDPQWIPDGCPGAGHITIFNNQAGQKVGRQYSSVVEIVPPLNPDGTYNLTAGVFGPAEPLWTYTATPPRDMYSVIISSAQRLPNGDTLICVGDDGRFVQVNAALETVWSYLNDLPDGEAHNIFRAHRYAYDYPGVAALQAAK